MSGRVAPSRPFSLETSQVPTSKRRQAYKMKLNAADMWELQKSRDDSTSTFEAITPYFPLLSGFLWMLIGTFFYAYVENYGVVYGFYQSVNIGWSMAWVFPAHPGGTLSVSVSKIYSTVHNSIGVMFIGAAVLYIAKQATESKDSWMMEVVKQDKLANSAHQAGTWGDVIAAAGAYSSKYKVIVFWVFWLVVGLVFGVAWVDDWDAAIALDFVLSSVSGGGYLSLPPGSSKWKYFFVALYTCIGMPITSISIGLIISFALISNAINSEAYHEALFSVITDKELTSMKIFGIDDGDGTIDNREFIILIAVRFGAASPGLLTQINDRFEELDRDRTGSIKYNDLIKGRRGRIVSSRFKKVLKSQAFRQVAYTVPEHLPSDIESQVQKCAVPESGDIATSENTGEPEEGQVAMVHSSGAEERTHQRDSGSSPVSPSAPELGPHLIAAVPHSDREEDMDIDNGQEKGDDRLLSSGDDVQCFGSGDLHQSSGEKGGIVELSGSPQRPPPLRLSPLPSSSPSKSGVVRGSSKGIKLLSDVDDESDRGGDSEVSVTPPMGSPVRLKLSPLPLSLLTNRAVCSRDRDGNASSDSQTGGVAPQVSPLHVPCSQLVAPAPDNEDSDQGELKGTSPLESNLSGCGSSTIQLAGRSETMSMYNVTLAAQKWLKKTEVDGRSGLKDHQSTSDVPALSSDFPTHSTVGDAKKAVTAELSRKDLFLQKQRTYSYAGSETDAPPSGYSVQWCAATLANPMFLSLFAWVLWIVVGTVFYALHEGRVLGDALYYSISVGYGIFWLGVEDNTASAVFTRVHFSLGMGAIGLMMASFASVLMDSKTKWYVDALKMKAVEEAGETEGYWDDIVALFTLHGQRLKVHVLFAVWVGAGVSWSCAVVGWSLLDGIYFSVSALTTGGLWPLPEHSPAWHRAFVALYVVGGVPVMAVSLGMLANSLSNIGGSRLLEQKIGARITEEEIDMMESFGIVDDDGSIDAKEFAILTLVRIGALQPSLICMIHQRFEEIDVNKRGSISYDELRSHGKGETSLHSSRKILHDNNRAVGRFSHLS